MLQTQAQEHRENNDLEWYFMCEIDFPNNFIELMIF